MNWGVLGKLFASVAGRQSARAAAGSAAAKAAGRGLGGLTGAAAKAAGSARNFVARNWYKSTHRFAPGDHYFEAVTTEGKTVRGHVGAGDKQEAGAKIRSMGHFPTRVDRVGRSAAPTPQPDRSKAPKRPPLPKRGTFARMRATMARAGAGRGAPPADPYKLWRQVPLVGRHVERATRMLGRKGLLPITDAAHAQRLRHWYGGYQPYVPRPLPYTPPQPMAPAPPGAPAPPAPPPEGGLGQPRPDREPGGRQLFGSYIPPGL